MTTKPKARKFRVRPLRAAGPLPQRSRRRCRSGAGGALNVPSDGQPTLLEPSKPAADHAQFVTHAALSEDTAPEDAAADAAGPATAPPSSAANDIQGIRHEGLTGRQLRMARRVALKNGLAPVSDFDAVRLLRAKGIDPFRRTNILELLVARDEASGEATRSGLPAHRDSSEKLPQIVPPYEKTLPSTDLQSPAQRRMAEIGAIQKDLARRRRRKSLLLLTRLAFFVFLPTMLAGYYFYSVATPMYATKSEFLILKAESGGGTLGSLFSGTQFATNQDAIAVQSYLLSKDAMLRLDEDEGFKAHFTQAWIDPIQRLEADPSNEEAYTLYKRNIEIGYDPTEGVIKMEIAAADPQTAAEFSRALIGYAEERVDNLSMRKRSNAVLDAEAGLHEAELHRREAQERLVRLQQEGAIVDPEGRIAAVRGQINTVEMQLQQKQLELQAMLDNARPNPARVTGAEADLRRLTTLLAQLNSQMTSAANGENSLGEFAVQIQLSQADLATRDMMLQSALERLEQARRDADSQARYLTTSVVPVASQDPSYPRKFENTILTFLIFSGIYLMVSLTASILREQVSS